MRRLIDSLIVAGATLILASLVWIVVSLATAFAYITLALGLGILGGLLVRLGGWLDVRQVNNRARGWRSKV